MMKEKEESLPGAMCRVAEEGWGLVGVEFGGGAGRVFWKEQGELTCAHRRGRGVCGEEPR